MAKYTTKYLKKFIARNGDNINMKAIPVLQLRIFDAGFEKLDIIPLGADKVLLRTEDDSDVNMMLFEAS